MADHVKRLEEIRNAAGWLDLAAVDVAALDAAIALMRGQSEDSEALDEMYLYELPNGVFESISPAATDLFRPDMLIRVLVADRNAGTRPAPPAAKQERDDA